MVRKLSDGRGLMRVSPTTRAILEGEEDLSVWSEEELIRGVRRGRDGRFRKAPLVIPKAVHDELVKRKMAKAYNLLRESTYDAVQVLVEVAKDAEADPAVRVKAAELILDRTLGKAPQHVAVDVTGDSPAWQQLVASAIVPTLQLPAEDIVEGEVVGAER